MYAGFRFAANGMTSWLSLSRPMPIRSAQVVGATTDVGFAQAILIRQVFLLTEATIGGEGTPPKVIDNC